MKSSTVVLTEQYVNRLKQLTERSLKNNNLEKALCSISACGEILYYYNQYYRDDDLEKVLLEISEKLLKGRPEYKRGDNNVVLYYDGFGLDRRGIAIVLNKAICLNGYKLVYVCPMSKKNMQPALQKEFEKLDVQWEFVENKGSFLGQANELMNLFYKWKPKAAFLYSTPWDSAGIAVFNAMQGKTKRILPDITDHAFWLGVNAFDICCGGRQLAADIQCCYRKIPPEKLVQLDANLYVDDCEYHGLPFEEGTRFVFSGGALYKTLGDEENTFYRIVEHILKNHPDVVYLYAGEGDASHINDLAQEFPGRVFLIDERPDFFSVMERCVFYLNTYPMFGGLMMRYAALAGKLPLTLKHGHDSDDILREQEKRQIEYNDYESMVADIDRLLENKDYLKEREVLLDGAVMTEDVYARNVALMIEEGMTEFPYQKIMEPDTEKFRSEFLQRFSYDMISRIIGTKKNKQLLGDFTKEFVSHALNKMKRG